MSTIDLAKTTGTSPPKAERIIYVTRDKHIEYREAIAAFRVSHPYNEALMKGDGIEQTPAYIEHLAKLEAVRQQVLGEQYRPGGGWSVTVERTPEQEKAAANVVYLEREEYDAFSAAMTEFILANQDAVRSAREIDNFKNRKTELKRQLLGDRYVENIKVRCTDKTAPHLPKAVFANLSTKLRFNPEVATKEEREYRADVSACRNWLMETFPEAFVPNSQPRKVLNFYIVSDILARFNMSEHEANVLRHAVNIYRANPRYHDAVVIGAKRVNLSGKIIGRVAADDVDYQIVTKRRSEEVAA